jgi:hypothetical protein
MIKHSNGNDLLPFKVAVRRVTRVPFTRLAQFPVAVSSQLQYFWADEAFFYITMRKKKTINFC